MGGRRTGRRWGRSSHDAAGGYPGELHPPGQGHGPGDPEGNILCLHEDLA